MIQAKTQTIENIDNLDDSLQVLLSSQKRYLEKYDFQTSATGSFLMLEVEDNHCLPSQRIEPETILPPVPECDSQNEENLYMSEEIEDLLLGFAPMEPSIIVSDSLLTDPLFEIDELEKEGAESKKKKREKENIESRIQKRQRRTNSVDSVFSLMFGDILSRGHDESLRPPSPSIISLGDSSSSSSSTKTSITDIASRESTQSLSTRSVDTENNGSISEEATETDKKEPTNSNANVNLRKLWKAMQKSVDSQQAIRNWDRKMGLKASHSATMQSSSLSRKKIMSSSLFEEP